MICIKCGFSNCFTCKSRWHGGQSCAEAQRDKFERELEVLDLNERSELVIERTTNKCPGCGATINKIDGCNYMICEFPPLCALNAGLVGDQ